MRGRLANHCCVAHWRTDGSGCVGIWSPACVLARTTKSTLQGLAHARPNTAALQEHGLCGWVHYIAASQKNEFLS